MFRSLALILVSLVVAAASAHAVTVEEIIQNNLEARGGLEKIRALKTVMFTGTMQSMGGEVGFSEWYKGNTKMRFEVKGDMFNMTQATDGIVVWGTNPMGGGSGPQVITGPQAVQLRKRADLAGDFVDTEEKGLKIELSGTEDLDGMTAYVLTVTEEDGETRKIYVDAITWYVVKMSQKTQMMGREMMVDVIFSNFQDIGGLVVPMQMDMKSDGMDLFAMTREKFEVNIPVEDEFFSLPSDK